MKKIIFGFALILLPSVSLAMQVESKKGAYGCFNKETAIAVEKLRIWDNFKEMVPYFDSKQCFLIAKGNTLAVINQDMNTFGVSLAQFSFNGVTFWGSYYMFDFSKAIWGD